MLPSFPNLWAEQPQNCCAFKTWISGRYRSGKLLETMPFWVDVIMEGSISLESIPLETFEGYNHNSNKRAATYLPDNPTKIYVGCKLKLSSANAKGQSSFQTVISNWSLNYIYYIHLDTCLFSIMSLAAMLSSLPIKASQDLQKGTHA